MAVVVIPGDLALRECVESALRLGIQNWAPRGSAEKPIIHAVTAYPEPEQTVRDLDGKYAMVKTDFRWPEAPGLQSQGRVMGPFF